MLATRPSVSYSNVFLSGTSLRVPCLASASNRQLVAISPLAIFKSATKAKDAPKKESATAKVKAQTFNVSLGKDSKLPITLGFTKDNELFVGRLAMLGFAFSIIGEILTGKGPAAQLGLETGLPLYEVDDLVLFLVAFNFIAAIFPVSGKFVPEEDFSDRSEGALQNPNVSLTDPKKFFGISGFGFTKENELFVGRLAQLGFAASLLGEALTGKGALGQFGFETGIPLTEAEPLLIFSILFTLFAAINPGSGKFVEEE